MMGNEHAAKVILWTVALVVAWLLLPSDLTLNRVIVAAVSLVLFLVGAMAFVWVMDLPWKRRSRR